MNGSTNGRENGHSTVSLEAGPARSNGGSTIVLSQIHEALDIVHGPYSSNESRRQASLFLEEVKTDDEAPYHGFNLASDKAQQPVVRHYALSLLEHAIKHKWAEFSEEQASALREWVVQLSQKISPEDPLYLRNKTAQLWVEIAKRSWAAEWTDMDEILVRLWELAGSVVHKEFVLFVLETLSDEVFDGEDTVAVLREGALSKACVEIFTPAIVLAEAFPNRQIGTSVRCGEEGWLVRLGKFLFQCLDSDLYNNPQYQTCAVKTLAVYRSVMPWAIPRAIASASCVQHMCKSLAASSVPVQLVDSHAILLDRALPTDLLRHPLRHSMACTAGCTFLTRSFSPSYVQCTQVQWLTYSGNCSNGQLLILMTSTKKSICLPRSFLRSGSLYTHSQSDLADLRIDDVESWELYRTEGLSHTRGL